MLLSFRYRSSWYETQMTPFARICAGLVAALFTTGLIAGPSGQLPLNIVVGQPDPAAVATRRDSIPRGLEVSPALERAIAAQERHTEALMRRPGTRGTAVSWDDQGEPVIRVYIENGGSAAGLPETLDGLPVQIEFTGPVYALNIPCEERSGGCDARASAGTEPSPRQWHPRPVPIGVSAGHVDITAGTIACRVTAGCHTYALSNAHVFADENSGMPGDGILQPGKYDGGIDPADRIGILYDSVPIVMTSSAFNRVDAAIAEVSVQNVGTATPSAGYGTPKSAITNPTLNMDVQKFGRTTSLTTGYIDAVNATILVSYDAGDARFVGQLIIRTDNGSDFSRPGDSGSLVVVAGGAKDRRPVGLLFASGTGITVANPISDVVNELGIDIDGE